MIAYYKLLDMLNKKDMTKEQLRIKAGLASGTMTKISKGEPVQPAKETIIGIENLTKIYGIF